MKEVKNLIVASLISMMVIVVGIVILLNHGLNTMDDLFKGTMYLGFFAATAGICSYFGSEKYLMTK